MISANLSTEPVGTVVSEFMTISIFSALLNPDDGVVFSPQASLEEYVASAGDDPAGRRLPTWNHNCTVMDGPR